jgi:dihydrofolate reductase
LGHHLLMGRKTFESIGRNLPGRQTILLTRQRDFSVDKTIIASSLEQAIDLAEGHQEQELFIVGGGEIFSQAIAQANRIYLTRVFARAGCDVFFPHLESGIWAELETAYFRADSRNDYSFIFSRMTRFKRNSP